MSFDKIGLFPEINVPSTSIINAFMFFDNKSFTEISEILSFTFQCGLSNSFMFILIIPSPQVQLQFQIVSCQAVRLQQALLHHPLAFQL